MALEGWDVDMSQEGEYAVEWEQRKIYETFESVEIDYRSWQQDCEDECCTLTKFLTDLTRALSRCNTTSRNRFIFSGMTVSRDPR